MISTEIGIWIAATLTISSLTMLYKDNTLYKFVEAIFLGVTVSHFTIMGITSAYNIAFVNGMFAGDWLYVIPVVLGAIYLMRLLPTEYGWPARYPVAILSGLGLGLAMRAVISTQFIQPMIASFVTLNLSDPASTVNSVIIMVLFVSTLYYFLYTFKGAHEGGLNNIVIIGRWGMMILFGSIIGSKVMTFATRFLGRIVFLLGDWLGMV